MNSPVFPHVSQTYIAGVAPAAAVSPLDGGRVAQARAELPAVAANSPPRRAEAVAVGDARMQPLTADALILQQLYQCSSSPPVGPADLALLEQELQALAGMPEQAPQATLYLSCAELAADLRLNMQLLHSQRQALLQV